MAGNNAKKKYGGARGGEFLTFLPEELTLVTDKTHPLFDPRVHRKPSPALLNSIRAHGVKTPIKVRRNGERPDGTPLVEVVLGRGRVMCCAIANEERRAAGQPLYRIKAIPQVIDDESAFEEMVIENEIREADAPSVRAKKMQRYLAMGYGIDDVALTFGCTKAEAQRDLDLLDLDAEVLKAFDERAIERPVVDRMLNLPRVEQKAALADMKLNGTLKGPKAAKAVDKAREARRETPIVRVRSRQQIEKFMAAWKSPPQSVVAFARWVLGGELATDATAAMREAAEEATRDRRKGA